MFQEIGAQARPRVKSVSARTVMQPRKACPPMTDVFSGFFRPRGDAALAKSEKSYILCHIPNKAMQEVPMETGKVFMCGRSQAVRIPRKLRFRTTEVTIQVKGDSLLLTPRQTKVTWEEFFARHTHPDFELERDETPPQARELL